MPCNRGVAYVEPAIGADSLPVSGVLFFRAGESPDQIARLAWIDSGGIRDIARCFELHIWAPTSMLFGHFFGRIKKSRMRKPLSNLYLARRPN
jgi:hypothetical protein